MKSFTTAVVFAASAALAAAQFTSNPDGSFTCAVPDAVYCVDGSNIIIRCTGTVGHPGNCNDNLAGQFPFGVGNALCYSTALNSGFAACSKNCVVYGGSGNINGTFTLPNCTPIATPTSSVSTSPSTSAPATGSSSVTPTDSGVISYTTIVNSYTTVTVPCISGTPITTPIDTFTTVSVPTTTGTGGGPGASGSVTPPISNGTVTSAPGGGSGGSSGSSGSSGPGGSATATPVGPTTSAPATFTGASTANQVGSLLAAVGLIAAYFL